jgi:hypothetical protein
LGYTIDVNSGDGVKSILSSPVSRPPSSETQDYSAVPRVPKPPPFSRGLFSFVLTLVVLLIVLLGLFLSTFPQLWQPAAVQVQTAKLDDDSSVVLSGKKEATTPQIPANEELLLEQQQTLSLISASNGHIKTLVTPGYIYNQAVSPVLLASGQVLYSGNGIWLGDIVGHASARKIFSLSVGQVLTSLVANDAGTLFAWSTAPAQGQGVVNIYTGTLANFSQVYQQTAGRCPCLRPFSFLHNSMTLLLSDDRGDHDPVYYGIWSLDLAVSEARPQAVLANNPAQGPLALSPTSNTLLYARVKGFVPAPTDGTVPDELASQSYANSLSLIALDALSTRPASEQELLLRQRVQSNSAAYHWVTTPSFSPDGRTLIYVLFSSDATQPYDRHNALYMVTFPHASKAQATPPQLLASSQADFIELGPWLDKHLMTFYADGSVYILDTEDNGLLKVGAVSGAYTRIIGVIKQG